MARVLGSPDIPFDQLVMSGGGLRCLWQGGFLEVAREPLNLRPKRIIGVSGGALSAAGFIAQCGGDVLAQFLELAKTTDRNVQFDRSGSDGLTPHQSAYRRVVDAALTKERQSFIAQTPHFQVYLAQPPAARFPALSGALAAMLYQLELHTLASPHFRWPSKMGVRGFRVDARAAAQRHELADLVCAAAVIPPIFEPPVWDGEPVIDGGMADQAPMPEPSEGQTLVLLTRHYRGLQAYRGRTYIAPSEDVAVDKIDFTNPQAMQASWDQGRRDAETYLARQQ